MEEASARVTEIGLRFGLTTAASDSGAVDPAALPSFMPGTLSLVSGPSGCGKTTFLQALARRDAACLFMDQLPFPGDVRVVDAIAPTRPLAIAVRLLAAAGLGEPRLWLRRFDQLSTGERFRAQLARALGRCRATGLQPLLLCDEFATGLHRRLAKAIAFNLRKLVTRERLRLVIATAHEDLTDDLRPDRIIRPGTSETVTDVPPCKAASTSLPTFAGNLRIERGRLEHYAALASMHYRRRDQVGFVDKVFVLRDTFSSEVLGVVVYGHPVLELAIRNRITGKRFVRNPARLNREMRVLKRLVIHPDVRGCGLGHRLVSETLPQVGTRFVECLAGLGLVHPVFERAGMRCMGVCEPPADRRRLMGALRVSGADPLASDFVLQVCRRPGVRRLVSRAVFDWYRPTGGGSARVARQSPTSLAQTFRQLVGSEPAYFIWARDPEGWGMVEGAEGHAGARVEGRRGPAPLVMGSA